MCIYLNQTRTTYDILQHLRPQVRCLPNLRILLEMSHPADRRLSTIFNPLYHTLLVLHRHLPNPGMNFREVNSSNKTPETASAHLHYPLSVPHLSHPAIHLVKTSSANPAPVTTVDHLLPVLCPPNPEVCPLKIDQPTNKALTTSNILEQMSPVLALVIKCDHLYHPPSKFEMNVLEMSPTNEYPATTFSRLLHLKNPGINPVESSFPTNNALMVMVGLLHHLPQVLYLHENPWRNLVGMSLSNEALAITADFLQHPPPIPHLPNTGMNLGKATSTKKVLAVAANRLYPSNLTEMNPPNKPLAAPLVPLHHFSPLPPLPALGRNIGDVAPIKKYCVTTADILYRLSLVPNLPNPKVHFKIAPANKLLVMMVDLLH